MISRVLWRFCPWHVACYLKRSALDLRGAKRREQKAEEVVDVLWTIFLVLLVLWAVGMVSSYTMGGFLHLLLVIAIAVVLIRVIQGRRPV